MCWSKRRRRRGPVLTGHFNVSGLPDRTLTGLFAAGGHVALGFRTAHLELAVNRMHSDGFERATVQSALSLHKAEMTRLLQVAEAVPAAIARAIGPAPKAGRTRWMLLADQLKTAAARDKAEREIATERFAKATSDERFVLMLERLTRKAKPATAAPEALAEAGGRVVAAFRADAKRPVIEFKGEGAFAAFVASEIPALYAAFKAQEGED